MDESHQRVFDKTKEELIKYAEANDKLKKENINLRKDMFRLMNRSLLERIKNKV